MPLETVCERVEQETGDEEERSLIRRAKLGDTVARWTLMQRQMRAIHWRAARFSAPGAMMDRNDLVQYGCLGVLKAIDLYDPDRSPAAGVASFSTYANYWIHHVIRRSVENYGRTVAVPISVQRDVRRLNSAEREHRAEATAMPALADMAEELGMSARRLESARLARHEMAPLDAMQDTIAEPEATEYSLHAAQCASHIKEAVQRLPERERYIIERLYGLGVEAEEVEATDLAVELGITDTRVRQLKRRAIERLRDLYLAEMNH